jgi:hypothetical protein
VQHQGHRFITGIVGAMPVIQTRALHAPRCACDQLTHVDVE